MTAKKDRVPHFYVQIAKDGKEAHKIGIKMLSEIAQSTVRIVTGEGVMLTIPGFLEACKKFKERGGTLNIITFSKLFSIPRELVSVFSSRPMNEKIKSQFKKNGYLLPVSTIITKIKDNRWAIKDEIKDGKPMYSVRVEASKLDVYYSPAYFEDKKVKLTKSQLLKILKNIQDDVIDIEKYRCDYKKAFPLYMSLIKKGNLKHYLAPGRPLRHFTVYDENHASIQGKHAHRKYKKFVYISDEPSLCAPWIEAFEEWKKECVQIEIAEEE